MNNENADMASMITTVNIAVTETDGEILGKHRQKKTPWVSANIVDLCNKRRELKRKHSNLIDLRITGKCTTTSRGA